MRFASWVRQQDGAVVLIRPIRFRGDHERRGWAQHREHGACLLAAWAQSPDQGKWGLSLWSLPQSYTTQSFSICCRHPKSHCPSTGAPGECTQANESVRGPFLRTPGFSSASIPRGWSELPLFFTVRCGVSSSQHQRGAWHGAGFPRSSVGNLCC